MRKIAGIVCVAILFGAFNSLRADDDAKVREIIDKAIKAHGGEDNLKKYQASVVKSKGKFHGFDNPIDYTSETSVQFPDKIITIVESKAGDMEFKFVQVVNGNKGWIKFGDNTTELNDDMLKEAREQMNSSNISHLTPLLTKEYKLSSLGEMKVGDRPAVGVRVERKDYRDVNVYFDKEKGYLLKVESRGKDAMSGQEYTGETFYEDYKKVDGMMVAHKITIKRDKKLYVEGESTSVKFSEKLDDGVFAKP